MLTRNKIKFINSLRLKKNRETEKLFVAEGVKVVSELIHAGWECSEIFTTDEDMYADAILISSSELQRISALKNPNKLLGVFKIRNNRFNKNQIESSVSLALDGVRDPGNLGTIIRIADWYGIQNVICSSDCVDLYNEKVIQSTMGSIARVNVCYVSLENVFQTTQVKKYAAVLEGDTIYNTVNKIKTGIIVMGSESHGISDKVLELTDQRITIPKLGGAESLNISVATGIICSEIFRG